MNGTSHTSDVEHLLAAAGEVGRCEGLTEIVRSVRRRYRLLTHDQQAAAARRLACRLATALEDWQAALPPPRN